MRGCFDRGETSSICASVLHGGKQTHYTIPICFHSELYIICCNIISYAVWRLRLQCEPYLASAHVRPKLHRRRRVRARGGVSPAYLTLRAHKRVTKNAYFVVCTRYSPQQSERPIRRCSFRMLWRICFYWADNQGGQ